MELIIKPQKKDYEDYIKASDTKISFLFGMDKLSTYDKTITEEELINIRKKYPDIKIYIAIDKNIFNEELPLLRQTLKEIDNLNLEGILFYDLSLINIKSKENLKTPLIWAQNFLATNYKTCNFYYNLGIKSCILSDVITTEEIKQIASNTNMHLTVNIFGYQIMSLSKRKLITNYLNHIKEDNEYEVNYLLKEGKKYLIKEKDNVGTTIYTSNILNGITKINELKEKDVNIILDEINIDHDKFIKVLQIYQEAVNNDLNNDELNKKDEEIKSMFSNTTLGFLDTKTIYNLKNIPKTPKNKEENI